jgi:hypothetical protein
MTKEYYIVAVPDNGKIRFVEDSNIGWRLTDNLMNSVGFKSKEGAELVLKQWKECWSNRRILNLEEATVRKVTLTLE